MQAIVEWLEICGCVFYVTLQEWIGAFSILQILQLKQKNILTKLKPLKAAAVEMLRVRLG